MRMKNFLCMILTATRNTGRILGLEDQLGSIEPGEKADIIATAGNPLHDIPALRVAAEVFSP